MAFKQNLVHRLLKQFSNQTLRNCQISSPAAAAAASGHTLMPPNPDRVAPDKGDESIFRRFLQQRPLSFSAAVLPESLRPGGGRLFERLREIDIARNQIRLDGLIFPAPVESPATAGLTVADAKKILRASQIETVKSKLRSVDGNHMPYEEFVEICIQRCSDRNQGMEVAKALDDSGSVIVLGNIVFLKPEKVLKVIHGLIPATAAGLPTAELAEMERWKAAIDDKAEKMVRRELWGGLAFLVVQTAAFMRLTFWELSWDVMEPICFYVTSMYFMIGYAFFLRTSKEPSFEGFFQSRFHAKQRKLMKVQGFDSKKYDELKKACYGHYQPWPRENVSHNLFT